jgi:transcription elongation factor Elf1
MSSNPKVNRYTRAGRNGKIIQCPKCNHHQVVYHFSWSAVTCQGCKAIVDKPDFYIPELSKEEASEIIDASRRDNEIREHCAEQNKHLWLEGDKDDYWKAFDTMYKRLVSTSGEPQ